MHPEDRLLRIHRMWDQLGDFDAAQSDHAIELLMSALCELFGGVNAVWIGAVRLDETCPADPIAGWRPRIVRYLRPAPADLEQARVNTRMIEEGAVSETTVRNVAGAGRFRVNRVCDLVGSGWFDSDEYRTGYQPRGYGDAVWVGYPVNADTECYIGVYRGLGEPRYTEQERDLIGYAVRGLKWLLRRLMLSHGLMLTNSPLTPAERQVLHGLLSGSSEKQIADAVGQSPHTTHGHIRSLFRKFAVKNRAALMAIWLGKPACPPLIRGVQPTRGRRHSRAP